jgi:hypothetical protein
MGGFVIRVDGKKEGESRTVSHLRLYHLTASDIVALRGDNSLEQLPSIFEEEINDKSKSDGLVRAIAILQIAWMALQIIIRASRRLAISQLEISVLAFTSYAVVIYGLNWERPKGVQVPYTVLRFKEDIPPSILQHLRNGMHESALENFVKQILGGIGISDTRRMKPGAPLLNHVSYFTTASRAASDSVATFDDVFGLFIRSVIFGAIHVTAWNFAFPTSIERMVWRITSVYCTSSGLLVMVMGISGKSLEDFHILTSGSLLENILVRGLQLICFIYVVARLFMLVETFRTLFFLPPSAYVATWASSNVPHVA